MRRIVELVGVVTVALTLSACSGGTSPASTNQSAAPAPLPPIAGAIPPAPTPPGPPGAPQPTRSLASFATSNTAATCYDRTKEPYTAVVDTHFHPKPFGGTA